MRPAVVSIPPRLENISTMMFLAGAARVCTAGTETIHNPPRLCRLGWWSRFGRVRVCALRPKSWARCHCYGQYPLYQLPSQWLVRFVHFPCSSLRPCPKQGRKLTNSRRRGFGQVRFLRFLQIFRDDTFSVYTQRPLGEFRIIATPADRRGSRRHPTLRLHLSVARKPGPSSSS